jgi:hypothetical protein
MHWYREGHRQRSKILYIFRTPGGVRVGRPALEPEVLRQIEAEYPEIPFDWPAIREHQQIVEQQVEPRRRRPRRDGSDAPAPPPPSATPAPAPAPQAASPAPIPQALQGATADDQIAFLTEWYPIVRERIPRKTDDPARQQALLALAERLNPAAWTDADQIASGLQQAAEALERLSKVFARRRRRARRRPAEGRPAPEASSPTES